VRHRTDPKETERAMVYDSKHEPTIGVMDVLNFSHVPSYMDADYPEEYRFYFHPMPHRYEYDDRHGNRKVFPSVTQILKSAGYIDDRWYPVGAADRGSYIHTMTAWIDDGVTTPGFCKGFEEEGYILAWEAFKTLWYFETDEIEKFGVDPGIRYAGTIDRIGRFASERIRKENGIGEKDEIVLDIKTGKKEKWHPLQLEAYRQTRPWPERVKIFGVYLKNDGLFDVVQFEGDYKELWNECVDIYFRQLDRETKYTRN